MAVHYKEVNHGSLKVSGIEHIEKEIRGGDALKRLLQRVILDIYIKGYLPRVE